MTDADYADDLALLTNTSAQVKSLLHNLEQAAGSIGLNVNANKTEFMCFEQGGAISASGGKPLKLVDQFVFLGNNISSSESAVNIWVVKVWTIIDRLLIIEI